MGTHLPAPKWKRIENAGSKHGASRLLEKDITCSQRVDSVQHAPSECRAQHQRIQMTRMVRNQNERRFLRQMLSTNNLQPMIHTQVSANDSPTDRSREGREQSAFTA